MLAVRFELNMTKSVMFEFRPLCGMASQFDSRGKQQNSPWLAKALTMNRALMQAH